jgi:hypothetical protein
MMARFIALPNEVLLNIFGRLPFIDDANHLARCIKHFSQLFEQNRLAIFKSIIVSSKAVPYAMQAVVLT